jgi:hypothetical protein
MKRLVTMCFVVVGLLAATSAMALDLHSRTSLPRALNLTRPMTATVVLGCDDGNAYNAYYQATDDRLGNLFDFGTSSMLGTVNFAHYGWGIAGPYDYDIEVWDPTSCTMVAAKNGLVASDAADAVGVETVDLCSSGIVLSGNMVVTIDPNSCVAPNDCYPDLMYDDQIDVFCPVIINNATTAPACYDVSPYNGPFLLRIGLNTCATPTHRESWGHLKSIYR